MSEKLVVIEFQSKVPENARQEYVGECNFPDEYLVMLGKLTHGEGKCPVTGEVIEVDCGSCFAKKCVFHD